MLSNLQSIRIYFIFITFFLAGFSVLAQDFTIAQNVTGNNRTDIRGQAFIPSSQDDGTGTITSTGAVYLSSFNVIYSAGVEADKLYIYSTLPATTASLDDGTGGVLVGESNSKVDGEFPYTNYTFNYLELDVNTTYYAVFRQNVQLEFGGSGSIDGPYTGGKMLKNDGTNVLENDFSALKFVGEFYENIAPNQGDIDALIALYNSTDGANWTNTWDLAGDPYDWYGVTWAGGNVYQINIKENNLNGVLPQEIGLLSEIEGISIRYNDGLVGEIPLEIMQLTKLTGLSLDHNSITGEIPPQIGDLLNLAYLYLDGNQMTGSIPTELSNLSNLKVLSLSYNSLTGDFSDFLGDFIDLEILDLGGNQISGNIPPSIGNLVNLYSLDLQNTNLSGEIPPEIGNLTKLVNFFLSGGNIEGNIPSEISNLINLDWLSLGYNNLSGSIPKELGNLSNLTKLSLAYTQIAGSIPPEIGNLVNLGVLILENNQLEGEIPNELGQLVNLSTIVLDDNNLTGSIPASFGNMKQLNDLIIRNNKLVGSIPVELASISTLGQISLPNNNLSGTIPTFLGDLLNLYYLDLSGNEFTGEIPIEIGNNLELSRLILNDNLLEGVIPSEIENLVKIEEMDLSSNLFDFSSFELVDSYLDGITSLIIDPQPLIRVDNDTIISELGSNVTVSISTGGENNLYQWVLNDTAISEPTTSSTLDITSLNVQNSGKYYCKITNSLVTVLTLYSEDILITYNTEFSATPVVEKQNAYSLNLNTTINKNGKLYYLALPTGSLEPTIEQIKMSLDADNIQIDNADSIDVTKDELINFSISKLTPSTSYDLYFAIVGDQGISSVKTKLNASTIAGIQFLVNYPEIITVNATNIVANVNTTRDGTIYYIALAQGSEAPSAQQIKTGTNALDEAITLKGSASVIAETPTEITINGLSGETLYDIYVVAQDAEDLFSEVTKLQVETITGLTENQFTENELSVYPNPAHGEINIEFRLNQKYDIAVTDLKGKTLIRKMNVRDLTKIDVSSLKKGIYLINVTSKDKSGWIRFVKK